MAGFYRSMEYIANQANGARDTKQSIINASNSYEYVKSRIRKRDEAQIQDKKTKSNEKIQFNPNEIEPIVLKNREKEER